MAKADKPDGRRANGRPKGAISKITKEAIEKAKAEGVMPLDYMLGIMRDDLAPSDRRDDMAKAAAPYLHSRLNSITLDGQVKVLTHEEALKQLAGEK